MKFQIQEKDNKVLLKVHVNPRSSRNQIAGFHGDALNVKITAPAVEGKANKALTAFLAEYFGLKKKQVEIKTGEKSREKVVALHNVSLQDVERRIVEGGGG